MPFPPCSSVHARRTATTFLAGLLCGPAWASDYLLGEMDSLAIDQPRITFGLTDETDPNNPVLIGPSLQNLALLDTGANGVLLGQLSFVDGEDYNQPQFNGQPATYNEQGVAGFEELDVFSPYALRLVDSAGNEFIADDNVIAFGRDNVNLGSFAAIVGMPAMAGRVVDIDLRPMLGLEFQGVNFHDNLSQVGFESAASLNVDLRMLPPVHTDQGLPPAMRPTFAALPLIDDIRLDHASGANNPRGRELTTSNTFLMDTGAQTTIISEAMAANLGLDLTAFVTSGGDVVDVLEVGGIGGTAIMPLVIVEELRLPTSDGIDMVYTNVLTGVLDIDGAPFDAVLGMNALTSGYTNAIFGGSGGGLVNPAVDKDTLDLFLEAGTVSTTQDLFDFGIITIEQEDFDLLVEIGILTDPTDPRQVFCELLILDEQTGTGATGVFFDRVVFDFTATDGTGIMRLDLNALHEAGDANYDDFVGTEDLDIILANWGQSVRAGSVLDGDLTGDGLVDEADLNLVLANWGDGTPPGSVPEPASAALMIAGLALVARRRRRPLAA